MNNDRNIPMDASRPRRSIPRKARGSALFLVMVSLVLLTVIATSFLQLTRVGRVSTDAANDSNIDAVIAATLAKIKTALRDDLLDDNGDFFKAGTTGGDDEAYDHPWTNTNTWTVSVPSTGSTASAKGGDFDDTWLASATPEFPSPTSAFWRHITNLNGYYLDSVGSASQPTLRVVDASSSPNNSDSSLQLAYSQLYDCDGDGVGDSRWTWAPLWKIGSVKYVMAVRIVDNSSMANLNAATGMTLDGDNDFVGASSNTKLIRGYYPTGVDLTRLMKRTLLTGGNVWTTASTGGRAQLIDFLDDDRGFSPTPTLPLEAVTREDQWEDRVRLYGEVEDRITLADEFELRYRNGLNNADQNRDFEETLSTLVREAETDETTYEDVSYTGLSVSDAADKRVAYFVGVDPSQSAGSKDGTPIVASRTFPAIRHMVTAISGAAVYAANHADMHSGAHTLRYDLVHQDDTDEAVRVTNMADRLRKIFLVTNTSGTTNAYLGLQYDSSSVDTLDGPELRLIADEFALAINDYSDADSTPTEHDVDTDFDGTEDEKAYGMETLPFLREAYIQARYKGTDTIPLDGNVDTWTLDEPSPNPTSVKATAMAVEIGNPFDRSISFGGSSGSVPSTQPRVRVAVYQGAPGTLKSSYELPNTITLAPRTLHLFYSNPSDQTSSESTSGNAIQTDLGLPAGATDMGDGTLFFDVDGSQVTVALEVAVDSTPTWVAYDRITTTGFDFVASPAVVGTISASPVPYHHGQISIARACERSGVAGIYYISNENSGTATPRLQERSVNTAGYSTTADNLDSDAKGVDGLAELENFQIPMADSDFRSVAELGWVHMFGFTNDTNGDFPQRFDALNASRRTLDFSSTATIPTSTGIPHAAMVMDQFTTLNPRYDGVDNDNDDLDNDDTTSDDNEAEQLVPGTINVNTMPRHLLALVSPLPEAISNPGTNPPNIEDLMTAVVNYRNVEAGSRPAGFRTNPGIESIGELMWVGTTGTTNDMQLYGDATDDMGLDINLYPRPEDVASATATSYSAAGSAEEAMSRFQFLSQVLTTRSDIFTAYVVIKGYDTSNNQNFLEPPVEFARFFAIFDRSEMVAGTDQPKLLGVYGY